MTYEMPELRLVGAASAVVLANKVSKLRNGFDYERETFDYSNEIEKEW